MESSAWRFDATEATDADAAATEAEETDAPAATAPRMFEATSEPMFVEVAVADVATCRARRS